MCVATVMFVRLFAAARAALHRFIQSRDSSQRERDLLKSVKVRFVVRLLCFHFSCLSIGQ